MGYGTILYRRDEGIGILTLNRPGKMNAINLEMLRELNHLLGEEIGQDDHLRVLIITGGERCFSVGADISVFTTLTTSNETTHFSRYIQQTFQRIESLAQPVLAAVSGHALGGGCELALACDLRFASEDASFGLPEVNLGAYPAAGGTQRLPRLIGASRAKEMMFSGQAVKAEEAYRLGLVNRLFPREGVLAGAKDYAHFLSAKPRVALEKIKALVNHGSGMDLEAALDYEAQCFGVIYSTADFHEGVRAFLEKRQPQFVGH